MAFCSTLARPRRGLNQRGSTVITEFCEDMCENILWVSFSCSTGPVRRPFRNTHWQCPTMAQDNEGIPTIPALPRGTSHAADLMSKLLQVFRLVRQSTGSICECRGSHLTSLVLGAWFTKTPKPTQILETGSAPSFIQRSRALIAADAKVHETKENCTIIGFVR